MPSSLALEYPSFKRLSAHLSSNTSKTSILSGHKQQVYNLGWSSDGRRLASTAAESAGGLRIWSMGKSSFECSAELKGGHKEPANSLIWAPDHAEKLASCSTDKLVCLWDIRSPKSAVSKIETEGENINISWSPDGKTIAVGNKEDVMSFIDIRGGSSGGGGASASAGGDGKTAEKSSYILKLLRNDKLIHGTSWNYGGDLFFQATGDGTVDILTYPALEVAHVLKAHTALCSTVVFDSRGRHFATGGGDGFTCLWDLDTLLCKGTISRLDSSIRSLSFSHDAELLAAGSAEDTCIDISHVDSGELVHSLKLPSGCIGGAQTVAFHPSKHILAYCCDEGSRSSTFGAVYVFNAFTK